MKNDIQKIFSDKKWLSRNYSAICEFAQRFDKDNLNKELEFKFLRRTPFLTLEASVISLNAKEFCNLLSFEKLQEIEEEKERQTPAQKKLTRKIPNALKGVVSLMELVRKTNSPIEREEIVSEGLDTSPLLALNAENLERAQVIGEVSEEERVIAESIKTFEQEKKNKEKIEEQEKAIAIALVERRTRSAPVLEMESPGGGGGDISPELARQIWQLGRNAPLSPRTAGEIIRVAQEERARLQVVQELETPDSSGSDRTYDTEEILAMRGGAAESRSTPTSSSSDPTPPPPVNPTTPHGAALINQNRGRSA